MLLSTYFKNNDVKIGVGSTLNLHKATYKINSCGNKLVIINGTSGFRLCEAVRVNKTSKLNKKELKELLGSYYNQATFNDIKLNAYFRDCHLSAGMVFKNKYNDVCYKLVTIGEDVTLVNKVTYELDAPTSVEDATQITRDEALQIFITFADWQIVE